MSDNVSRPIAVARELPAFELNPNAHRIASDQEALAIARELVTHLVLELQRRGVYKRDYTSGTLREKLFGAGPRLPKTHVGARYRDLAVQGRALDAAE